MCISRLYLFVGILVLCLSGCGQDRSNRAAPQDAETPDTAAAPSNGGPATSSASPSTNGSARETALQVLVLGNSIAAGYGLPNDAPAFPALLQQKADSLGWAVRIRNAGESGMTTAGGRSRIGWLLRQPVDVLLLELGGNDGLRGVDPAATRKNLSAIIDSTLARYPDARVLLAGMQIPPNLGPDYTRRFREVYPSVADRYDQVMLIPFVLEGVGGVERLMQSDGIHPNATGQRRVAETIWNDLRPLLERMRREKAEA